MAESGQARASHKRPPLALPIQRRIAMLLVIPLLSLLGLWGFSASITLRDAVDNLDFSLLAEKVGRPAFAGLAALEMERSAAAAALGSTDPAARKQFEVAKTQTDGAIAAFRKTAYSDEAQDTISEQYRVRLVAVDRQLNRLSGLRGRVDLDAAPSLQVIDEYNAIRDSANALLISMVSTGDVAMYRSTLGLITVNSARDQLLRADALVSAAATVGGRLSLAERTAFVKAVGNRRQLLDAGLASAGDGFRERLTKITSSPDFERLQALEDRITYLPPARSQTIPADVLDQWRTIAQPIAAAWWQLELREGVDINNETDEIGSDATFRLALAGGLGLLAVLLSVALSFISARGISRELKRLQEAAHRLANERLPRVVAQLRRGEPVDLEDGAPQLATGRTKEITQVAEAFGTVQRTAVDSAVGEARLRQGLNRVFLNLAWRSQSLLHRQLKILDSLESRASEPEELKELFQLDHLTTRMRRHAEGLVILSGAPTARGWNQPVPVEDLLRAALAEVEDYTRVDVMTSSTVALTGAAVADVMHLLAELIENATHFSPPSTEVLVRGELVAKGLAIEVLDRGIGINPDELAETNRRLANPPEFDLADSDRLGLFVVARLAARHGIKVVLQTSAYGGITAVVLIPNKLIVTEPVEGPEPGTAGRRLEPSASGGRLDPPTSGELPRQVPAGAPPYDRFPDNRPPHNSPAYDRPPYERPPEPVPGSSAPDPALERSNPGRLRAHPGWDDSPPAPPGETAGGRPSMPGRHHATWENTEAHDAAPSGDGFRAVDGLASDDDTGGLPKRLRQQNLAPQLRDRPAASPPRPAADHDAELQRPEHSRDLMSSLQAGWTAGRDADEGQDQQSRETQESRESTASDRRTIWGEP